VTPVGFRLIPLDLRGPKGVPIPLAPGRRPENPRPRRAEGRLPPTANAGAHVRERAFSDVPLAAVAPGALRGSGAEEVRSVAVETGPCLPPSSTARARRSRRALARRPGDFVLRTSRAPVGGVLAVYRGTPAAGGCASATCDARRALRAARRPGRAHRRRPPRPATAANSASTRSSASPARRPPVTGAEEPGPDGRESPITQAASSGRVSTNRKASNANTRSISPGDSKRTHRSADACVSIASASRIASRSRSSAICCSPVTTVLRSRPSRLARIQRPVPSGWSSVP
jgi:hypothetical protein